jgi:2-iminobutanoate/2-iminopropanoate deaminase
MSKECIISPGAPPAVGPYSHAVAANGFVFASGQCPFAPDGSGPVRGTVEEETRLALDNLKGILEHAGSGMQHVVKTTCYLKDMADFAAFNGVYKEYFPENPPARTCIQAGALPLGVQVEVEAIAVLPQ